MRTPMNNISRRHSLALSCAGLGAAQLPLPAAGQLPAAVAPPPKKSASTDWRDIRSGWEIPTVNYADQPYMAKLKNGHWLCTLTTGPGNEGDTGEFVGVTTSPDRGRTWTPLRHLEDPKVVESAYSTPFVTPSGRVFVFYDYNGDNFRAPRRSDELGWFVYRYSDDHGVTWSERHRVPMRLTRVDRENTFQGKVQLFWCVSHPVAVKGEFFLSYTKMKTYPQTDNEGFIFHSRNLLTERDPSRIEWELLPDGDTGIRSEALGRIQEEHNIVPLSDGSLYCMYRTATGNPACALSRDGARTWSQPQVATYADGTPIKTPIACPMMWRASNGRYLFWFHNNGLNNFNGRNPVWLAGGREENGTIAWSQPEILFYEPDDAIGMSYPDMLEEGDDVYFFHTQKQIARTNQVDRKFLDALWTQATRAEVPKQGLKLELTGEALRQGSAEFNYRPALCRTRRGMTIDLRARFGSLKTGQVLLDSRNAQGAGYWVSITGDGAPRLDIRTGDGADFGWSGDPGLLTAGKEHSVAFILDGASKTLSVVIDGKLCDGGKHRAFGWTRLPGYLNDVNPSSRLRLAPDFEGQLLAVRAYDRYLLTSEAVNLHLVR
ncbi:MAG: exo-alpha-sialidase [Acidobacteria bacterium]|nr:exo-alpha-sialidase [Acidobacteriota bacterium]